MYRYIPEIYLNKARQGAEFVPITFAIGGIKVYKKTILFKDIVPHIQKRMEEAIKAIYDIKDETPKGKTMEEYLESILTSQSGYLGKPMTNRDVNAYILSKLTEIMAILKFLGKDY